MKRSLLAISLITCVSVTLPVQAFAVTLYGAGSLTSSLTEVSNSFTQKYGIPITTQFGPSGSLRERLEKGEKADVFASADIGNPLKLSQSGLSGSVVNFTSNRMTAIVRPGLSVTSNNILDLLLDPNIKVGISTPINDPSGDYAQEIFQKADKIKPGSYQILNDKSLQLVGGNPTAPVVPMGKNNLVYFLEETKQADVFLAYYTSGVSARQIAPDLQLIELPENLAVNANYGLTVLKGASEDGEKLANYILSPDGQKILTKYGFSSPSSTSIPECQGIGGMFVAAGVAFAVQKKLAAAKKQNVKYLCLL